ncbi:uncharacterized protein LY89DRAFT_737232 [Mollisia scopiformis]|uniref:Uncharacterized protein n=1 Tax=Mollisia scopiformis TaxID=149040 RepID=A0A194WZ74_MOLSC|nr:uncharacterized protein LY89DRAFT_737232 [Mollisia scopiformis]KUJ13253.1 hypothetical protein LY89DRAFT_737232 [Mollisia scopiformis]
MSTSYSYAQLSAENLDVISTYIARVRPAVCQRVDCPQSGDIVLHGKEALELFEQEILDIPQQEREDSENVEVLVADTVLIINRRLDDLEEEQGYANDALRRIEDVAPQYLAREMGIRRAHDDATRVRQEIKVQTIEFLVRLSAAYVAWLPEHRFREGQALAEQINENLEWYEAQQTQLLGENALD